MQNRWVEGLAEAPVEAQVACRLRRPTLDSRREEVPAERQVRDPNRQPPVRRSPPERQAAPAVGVAGAVGAVPQPWRLR